MNTQKLIKFRDKFAEIPETQVISRYFTNEHDSCCVLGHYNRLNSRNSSNYSRRNCITDEKQKLNELRALSIVYLPWGCIADVNNGEHSGYRQSTPKQRSLAFLDDMIAWKTKHDTTMYQKSVRLAMRVKDRSIVPVAKKVVKKVGAIAASCLAFFF